MALASQIIPFASFLPDQSDYMPNGSTYIKNGMPTADGWGPVGGWMAIGTGLPTECKGSFTARTVAGGYKFYAGTATKLYIYNSGTSSFDDISRAAGGNYAVPSGYKWSFAQFGSYLLATNGVDVVQFIDVDSGTLFALLPGSPPVARYVYTTGEFVVLAAISGALNKLRWSGIGNAEFWTIGQKGCDEQAMPDGGEIRGFIGYESGGYVLQKSKMRRMVYSPSGGFVFNFSVVQNEIGSVGSPSIIPFRNTFFFISDGGFYQGETAEPIGDQQVNEYFKRNVDTSKYSMITGSADPEHKMAWWAIPRSDGTWFLMGYHWLLKRWTIIDADVSHISNGATSGYNLDNLTSFGNIDTLPYSLDSNFWKGGILNFSAFAPDGSFGFFHGSTLEATIETNDVALVNGQRAFVQAFRLISDATGHTGKISGRDNPGAALEWTASITPSSYSGKMLARKRGRTHRAQITIPAGTDWNNANGVEIIYKQAGNR